jgi:hypothetical protein
MIESNIQFFWSRCLSFWKPFTPGKVDDMAIQSNHVEQTMKFVMESPRARSGDPTVETQLGGINYHLNKGNRETC